MKRLILEDPSILMGTSVQNDSHRMDATSAEDLTSTARKKWRGLYYPPLEDRFDADQWSATGLMWWAIEELAVDYIFWNEWEGEGIKFSTDDSVAIADFHSKHPNWDGRGDNVFGFVERNLEAIKSDEDPELIGWDIKGLNVAQLVNELDGERCKRPGWTSYMLTETVGGGTNRYIGQDFSLAEVPTLFPEGQQFTCSVSVKLADGVVGTADERGVMFEITQSDGGNKQVTFDLGEIENNPALVNYVDGRIGTLDGVNGLRWFPQANGWWCLQGDFIPNPVGSDYSSIVRIRLKLGASTVGGAGTDATGPGETKSYIAAGNDVLKVGRLLCFPCVRYV
jgi:hypothetical protein